MEERVKWLIEIDDGPRPSVDGLMRVSNYDRNGRPPEEVAVMEKAKVYGAHAVFFEASRNDRASVAQAFVFLSDGPADDPSFGELHRRYGAGAVSPYFTAEHPA